MHIAITGGTGLIGSALSGFLTRKGHHVYILTRNKHNKHNKDHVTFVEWLHQKSSPEDELPPLDAIVNLAGTSINNYWTKKYKQNILDSRIHATKEVLRFIENSSHKPKVLINASAVGYYGVSKEKIFTESSTPSGQTFLRNVCEKWEKEASRAKQYGIRTVYARFGLILDNQKGALPRLMLPYSFFAGGPIGSGHQCYSWIHLKDAVEMVAFAIENKQLEGPMNVTAPNPETMNNFGKKLAIEMGRPHWIPTPAFVLKGVLGEMSSLILEGQYVLPDYALKKGYTFSFPKLEDALRDLLKNK